jgi:hypothetical protein
MNPLQKLYEDKQTLEALRLYFRTQLEAVAIKRVFSRQSTDGLADADVILGSVFNQMDIDFGKNKKPQPITSR